MHPRISDGDAVAKRNPIARKKFVEYGTERLVALCDAIGGRGDGQPDPLVGVFQRLVRPWGGRRVGARPKYRSSIADDGAPFEFAIAISHGTPEVQVYVEAQGDLPTLRSNMAAGRVLLEDVASDLGAPLDRLRQVESIFFPDDPHPPFTVWIGASCTAGRLRLLKIYLNPQVRGADLGLDLVAEAMARLGFARAWTTVRQHLSSGGDRRDEAGIVSLDLSNAEDARVKVYLRHHQATVTDLDAIARLARSYHPGDAATFYAAAAEHEGPYRGKPALTELAFVDPDAAWPASVTLEFPVGSHVATDEIASQRIVRCLAAFGLPSPPYLQAIRAFATRPLERGPGIHAHVTMTRAASGPRVGVYLASEAYHPERVVP